MKDEGRGEPCLISTHTSYFRLHTCLVMAERVGFEPTVPLRVHALSRRAPSSARSSLRIECQSTGGRAVAPSPFLHTSYLPLPGGEGGIRTPEWV